MRLRRTCAQKTPSQTSNGSVKQNLTLFMSNKNITFEEDMKDGGHEAYDNAKKSYRKNN